MLLLQILQVVNRCILIRSHFIHIVIRRRRRRRTTFTIAQRQILEWRFQKNNFIRGGELRELAHNLGLSVCVVKNYFQNR